MKIDKKLRNRIEQIDNNLDNMVKNPYRKQSRFPLWAKFAIPIGGAALSVGLVLAIVLPIASNASGKNVLNINGETYTRLTEPKREKVTETSNMFMSSKTYDSYMAFSKKFTKLVMDTNNKKKEDNLAVSIPDAYLCLAITGIISDEKGLNDVLSYFELSSIDELRVAAKEVVSTLGTLFKNKEGKLVGGFNLNSIWLNPDKVRLLKEKDEELYKDLEEIFDASLYMGALTSNKANQYLQDNGLKEMPVPSIELDDSDPSALSVMSVFYYMDSFVEAKKYLNEYKKGTHKMDYTVNGTTKKVDYIEKWMEISEVYENEKFYGSPLWLDNSCIDFFLPNDRNALPSSILDDVLDENYHLKKVSYIDPFDGSEEESTKHSVNISAPYFSLDNKIELGHDDLSKVFPNLTLTGAASRLAETLSGDPMCLDSILQFSKTRFNYDGFYSCSVTITQLIEVSALVVPGRFELVLDHPYVFETKKTVLLDGDKRKGRSIPAVIGEIIDPVYTE